METITNTDTERRLNERTDNSRIETQIDRLLQDMTIEEKAGQMLMINISEINRHPNKREFAHVSVDETKFLNFVNKYKVGSFLNGIATPPESWYRFSKTIQELNLKHSRLNIPLIFGIDHIHGANYISNATIFPQTLNLAATFRSEYARHMGRITGVESADLGHHWIFAPITDLGNNPKFARFYETAGEDPYLAAELGKAFVEGLQDNPETAPYRQAATVKHFLGYSDPKSGWDRTPAQISDQSLHEFHVPPFLVPMEAGAMTVMIQGGEINGIPVNASAELLTGLLRDKMKFKGVAVTDWEDVERLHTLHNVADDMKEAVYQAVTAGIDICMAPFDPSFQPELVELVKEGRISEERLDLSVSRILRLKLELGLFDHPFPRNDRFDRIGNPAHTSIALESARESLVLMKNEHKRLPLKPGTSIVLAGQNAAVKRGLAGGWVYEWIPEDDKFFPTDMPTLYDGLSKEFDVVLSDEASIAEDAARADAVIIATGELPYAEGWGDFLDQSLDKKELRLIDAAIETGKPVIIVFLAGRPRIVSDQYDKVDAFIWAGWPGPLGAQAITDVLTGKSNPSGKMPFSWPRYPAVWFPYNHRVTDHRVFLPVEETDVWLQPFGQGLSYTEFTYSNLEINASTTGGDGSFRAKVTVTNTGKLPGAESVLWYIYDEKASVSRPVRMLKHFEKHEFKPGENKVFEFEIIPDTHLWFPDEQGEKVLEEGWFTLYVGDQKTRFNLVF